MAELTIQRRDVGIVQILTLVGALAGDECAELRFAMIRVLEDDNCKILLDFSAVSSADHGGIQELINAYRTAWNYSAQLKLVHVSPQIKTQLLATRCLRPTDLFDNEQTAVDSFV